jgi:hypothetical protein
VRQVIAAVAFVLVSSALAAAPAAQPASLPPEAPRVLRADFEQQRIE